MTIREIAIAKLQQLPEPLLQQVSDFIDLLAHQATLTGEKTTNQTPEADIAQAWARWFECVDRLEVAPNNLTSNYQQLLLTKYRQQGLKL